MAWTTIRITLDGLPDDWQRDDLVKGDVEIAADEAADHIVEGLRKTNPCFANVTVAGQADID